MILSVIKLDGMDFDIFTVVVVFSEIQDSSEQTVQQNVAGSWQETR